MNQDYKQIVESVKLYITFSDIHKYKVPKEEIIKKIERMDKKKALIILSRFSMVDEEVLEIIKSQLMKKMGVESGSFEYEKYVPFGPDNLLYTIKWFLAYGRINLGETVKISKTNLNDVLDVLLKISDYMIEEIDGDDSLRELAFKATLTLKGERLRRSLYRQNIMFDQIATDVSLFNQKEYIDIHAKFEEVNGFRIKDYVATLFTLAINSELKISKEQLITSSVEKDPVQYFSKTTFTPQALKVCGSFTVNPNSLKDWALETIENPFDYEAILSTPFFSINQKLVVSSPAVIESALFDGLFFRIKNCVEADKFFNFYGRIFEQYVSKTLASAVSNSEKAYEVIPEFKYGKEKKDSSDVYLKLGKSLLIFECKSGRISRNTKVYAEEKTSEKDFKKYVICPLRQAYRTYEQIIEDNEYAFGEINKIYIFSISSQAFPKVANKKLNITKEMIVGDNTKVKGIDYIGLDDFETIAYAIEKHKQTIFSLINKKINHRYYLKYDSYLYNEGYELDDIKWYKEVLSNTLEDIKNLMTFEN